MKRATLLVAVAALATALSVGCRVRPGGTDGGNTDGGNTDGGNADGGNPDGGNPDGGGGRVCPTPVLPSTTPICDPTTGLAAPKTACSAAQPCSSTISGTMTVEINDIGTLCHGDQTISWTDVNGDARWACIYRPPSATSAAPRPMLIFFPPSMTNADSMYTQTGFRTKAETVDLTQGAGGPRPGFILVTLQPRNLHDGNSLGDGQKFDYSYRDLGTDSCNPDIRSADHLIDMLVAEGNVDPTRIYISGWSNGAVFSQLYGIARHDTPTPGGNHVAAVVAYAGGDPFIQTDSSDNCGIAYLQSTFPSYNIHRSCDSLSPCDDTQEPAADHGINMEDWIQHLSSDVMDPNVADVIIASDASDAGACLVGGTAQCNSVIGALNHLHWPDGSGNDVIDREPGMLDFFRNHPRN